MTALGRSTHVRGKGSAHDNATCTPRSRFPYLPVRTQVSDKGNPMTAPSAPYAHFRLNLEQQKKRAKELLRAARAGDPAAAARFSSTPQLAEAQYLIARDLRFDSWSALKHHIEHMTREREGAKTWLDGDHRTLHIRCGSDLRQPLQAAGFSADFCEHSYPYLIGPVREGPGAIHQRAQFLVDSVGKSFDPPLEYESVLSRLEREEQQLLDSASYDRVVIWSEHDCYDQLVLVRVLAHYATHRTPPQLETVTIDNFPGGVRFIGLGQLPPEALRLLWGKRTPVTPAALRLGLDTWQALTNPDPRALAAIMRGGTPELPPLALALHRHLRELPSSETGLSFTQEMALQLLAEQEMTLERLFVRMTYERDPLPGQGDLQVRDRVLSMEGANARVFERRAGVGPDSRSRPPWTDILSITDLGRAVLKGDVDFLSLKPPGRWVGGVQVDPATPDWRWNEEKRDAARGT